VLDQGTWEIGGKDQETRKLGTDLCERINVDPFVHTCQGFSGDLRLWP
jgi:hypothetical protein